MLMLHATKGRAAVKAPKASGCGCTHLVDSYVWQRLAAPTRAAFELHMMECAACLSSVELERLLRRAIRDHITSCGKPCATRIRRIG